jgi:hypothetical protein
VRKYGISERLGKQENTHKPESGDDPEKRKWSQKRKMKEKEKEKEKEEKERDKCRNEEQTESTTGDKTYKTDGRGRKLARRTTEKNSRKTREEIERTKRGKRRKRQKQIPMIQLTSVNGPLESHFTTAVGHAWVKIDRLPGADLTEDVRIKWEV